jgi:hypothetical protein
MDNVSDFGGFFSNDFLPGRPRVLFPDLPLTDRENWEPSSIQRTIEHCRRQPRRHRQPKPGMTYAVLTDEPARNQDVPKIQGNSWLFSPPSLAIALPAGCSPPRFEITASAGLR